MVMKAKFIFLGTGASSGVPVVGCNCSVCLSTLAPNQRMRASALLKVADKSFLIDVGPDFRQQALKNQIKELSGLYLTHAHLDHIGGLGDLATLALWNQKTIPCLLSLETFNSLLSTYPYLINAKHNPFSFTIIEKPFGVIDFHDFKVQYVSYHQNGMLVHGFRWKEFAYISDIRDYEPKVLDDLKGTKTLVISALRRGPSKSHFNLEEAIDFSKKLNAQRTYFTHLSHDLDHEFITNILPSGCHLAYDGLEIEVDL
ncbi:MAG: MBL fold metallo-hydrolase [Rhabdochlamydiaceae bacterium]